jgi:hypothetical protein
LYPREDEVDERYFVFGGDGDVFCTGDCVCAGVRAVEVTAKHGSGQHPGALNTTVLSVNFGGKAAEDRRTPKRRAGVNDGWKCNFADDMLFDAGVFAGGVAVAGEILT